MKVIRVHIDYGKSKYDVSREIYYGADFVFLINSENYVKIVKFRNDIDHVRSVVNCACERYAYLNEMMDFIRPHRNIKIDFLTFLTKKLTHEKLFINSTKLLGYDSPNIRRNRIMLQESELRLSV